MIELSLSALFQLLFLLLLIMNHKTIIEAYSILAITRDKKGVLKPSVAVVQ